MHQHSLLRTQSVSLVVTVIAVIAGAIIGGPEVAAAIALLAVLEVSISFDNAIVNAQVLRTMTERWQRIFLTWGILIAVFGMRLVFPIVIVAVAAGLPVTDVVDQALNNPSEYARNLEDANPIIAAFGGAFLLMVFLDFFLDDDKDVHWLGPVERGLEKLGGIESMSPAIAGLVLIVVSQLVASEDQKDVLLAGLTGIVIHLLVAGISGRLEPDDVEEGEDDEPDAAEVARMSKQQREAMAAGVAAAAKGGLASFLYLEVLDASFSFDGVIGAFAISQDIIVIAVGLGLGALFIRTLTVYLVRAGTLQQYRYLEHGAHWAIGALAVILFIGIEHHLPEVVTGSIGAILILAALYTSIQANKHDEAETGQKPEAVTA